MAFRPNYRQERSQRDRSAKSRQEEKLQKLQERAAKRKAEREGVEFSARERAAKLSQGRGAPVSTHNCSGVDAHPSRRERQPIKTLTGGFHAPGSAFGIDRRRDAGAHGSRVRATGAFAGGRECGRGAARRA